MTKGLFFDGNLYGINERAVEIIECCRRNPTGKDLNGKFSGVKELSQLIASKVIIQKEGKYCISGNVKLLPSLKNVLTAITFYFGFQCNLNCNHCHSRIVAQKKRESMNFEQSKYITEEIIKANPLSVRLGGGEPLMRKDFMAIISRITEAGITASFTTNGWYLNKKVADELKKLNNLEPTRLSIHGFGEEHDMFTKVKGSFLRLLRAQRILKKFNLEHKFVVVICNQTKSRIKDFINFTEELGADGILFRALKLSGNADFSQFISPEEWRSIYQLIINESKKRKIKIDFSPSGPPVAKYIGLKEKCLCGRNTLTIRPSGDFSACGIAFDKIGNVFNDSIFEFWKSHPKFMQIRQGFCPCKAEV